MRRFGYLLAEIALLFVLAIFAFNVFLHKPVLDSFMFALALAVGLTPQLLRAIITEWKKLDELPYDFARKRLSILFERSGRPVLITKGALPQVLSTCLEIQWSDGTRDRIETALKQIDEHWRRFNSEGCRVLPVGYRSCAAKCSRVDRQTETALIFLGLVALSDHAKTELNLPCGNCAISALN